MHELEFQDHQFAHAQLKVQFQAQVAFLMYPPPYKPAHRTVRYKCNNNHENC